jgi:hypothetical protein
MYQSARRARRARNILLPLVILAAFAGMTSLSPSAWPAATLVSSGQQPAPGEIGKEPHHRLLLENSYARIFAVTIPHGQQSVVWHQHNFLTIALADSDVIRWNNDESPIQHVPAQRGEVRFFLGKSAHGIRNDSNADYSDITVEFLDPQVTNYGYRYESGKWDFGPSVLNPPVDPEGHFVNSLDLEKAVAKEIQLLPKETLLSAKNPQLLIAVTALNLSAGTDRKISLRPGGVLWREAGDPELANNGSVRERLVVVEFKPANGKY